MEEKKFEGRAETAGLALNNDSFVPCRVEVLSSKDPKLIGLADTGCPLQASRRGMGSLEEIPPFLSFPGWSVKKAGIIDLEVRTVVEPRSRKMSRLFVVSPGTAKLCPGQPGVVQALANLTSSAVQ
jgi:hypothetical protein